jgi:hypothetical protein
MERRTIEKASSKSKRSLESRGIFHFGHVFNYVLEIKDAELFRQWLRSIHSRVGIGIVADPNMAEMWDGFPVSTTTCCSSQERHFRISSRCTNYFVFFEDAGTESSRPWRAWLNNE